VALTAGCASSGEDTHTLAEARAAFNAEGMPTVVTLDRDHTTRVDSSSVSSLAGQLLQDQPGSVRGLAFSDEKRDAPPGKVTSIGDRWQLFVLDSTAAANAFLPGLAAAQGTVAGFSRLQADNVVAVVRARYAKQARRAFGRLDGS
jgi:hypothetical protein